MSYVKEVTVQQLSREIATSALPVVVDVYTSWCGPCRMLAPVLERLAEQYQGRIQFLKIDAEEEPGIADIHPIQGVPTLLFAKDGEIMEEIVGLPQGQVLTAKLNRYALSSERMQQNQNRRCCG